MRRTVWSLLLVLLLQLMLGTAWAMHRAQASKPAAHCHETSAQPSAQVDAQTTHATQGKVHSPCAQGDAHHCCAVGFGIGIQPMLPSLPQTPPASQHGFWISQSLRPDLRPPI
jgi:hypothetical protein